MSDPSTETKRLLQQLARRAESEPDLLAGVLARYRALERLDETALAARLSTDDLGVARLGLCKRPRTDAPRFGDEVQQIAAYVHADAVQLANVIRHVESLEAFSHKPMSHSLREIPSESLPNWSPVLSAARDREEIEEEAQDAESSGTKEDDDVAGSRESQAAIDEFWQRAGKVEPFPRNLESAMAFALPIALVKLPRLRLWDIENYLQRREIAFQFDTATRAVQGCLIAYEDKGIIFIDGSDPDDERRVTLAHEIGHFVADYQMLRRKAMEKVGGKVLEVLDGRRAPSFEERVYAALNQVAWGVYWNLIERDAQGNAADAYVWKIERRADRIALALLAPPHDVLVRVNLDAPHFQARQSEMTTVLEQTFGLPQRIALTYAHKLLESVGKGASWVEHFRGRT